MKEPDIKALLARDLQNKKSYDAMYPAECSQCGDDIFEGDTFYFMGEKEKVCQNCYNEVADFLGDEG
jgi:hypothetical protein